MNSARRKYHSRKNAFRKLNELMSNTANVNIIHYSCESFYDRSVGTSPRITSIAILHLGSSQSSSFSIHQIAERQGYSLEHIDEYNDELEKLMLEEFYDYVKSHKGYTWLHWNMKNIHYGFQAIAHRYKVLGGEPPEINESQLVDLSGLLIEIYGRAYIPHPRLQNLVEKNNISTKDFLTGAQEAEAFNNKEYVKLHFSTLRKVDILATIAKCTDENTLSTNATWKDMFGFYPAALIDWFNEQWFYRIIEIIFAIFGFIAAIIQIRQMIQK